MDSVMDILTKPRVNAENGDFYDEDGILTCGVCGEKKQYPMDLEGRIVKMFMACECDRERFRREEEMARQEDLKTKIEALKRAGITDAAYLSCTFEQDDVRDKTASAICHRYVDNFAEMLENNIGILFYGGVGTGKSFLACCIANALLNDAVSVCVTNFPRMLNRLQSLDDRQAAIDDIARYKLLVLDDLGVERETSYAQEQAFNIIDTRYRSGRPLIVTTNLTLQELKNPTNTMQSRIFDRVLDMCPIRICLNGESRRKANEDKRQKMAVELLSD